MRELAHDTSARFRFGENWSRFLIKLDDDRISAACASLKAMLKVDDLSGMTFLDIGSGSGLFSLAARRLGARVTSFDYDPQSVACTQELRRRYFENDPEWQVMQGSVLDSGFVGELGDFDIVYSWGVLHHTGAMWTALELAMSKVKAGGLFYIALYNDQGLWSRIWWIIKYIYNKLPSGLRNVYAWTVWNSIKLLVVVKYTLLLNPMKPLRELSAYKPRRGMDVKTDVIDWMGGFPFEVVGYEALKDYLHLRGFDLVNGLPDRSLGCHEFVFRRRAS